MAICKRQAALRPKQANSDVSTAGEHRGLQPAAAHFAHWMQQNSKTFQWFSGVTAERKVVQKWADL